jgi:serralysin
MGVVSGNDYGLQSLETSFQQDLNGDGTVGPKTTTIEAFGTTRLDEVANEFFLHDANGNGPSLKYGGTDVVAGEFGAWTPIGAEQIAGGGFEVAWQNGTADQYGVWSTDSNGNFASTLLAPVSGASPALKAFEPSFHQDLNKDGIIG